MVNSDTVGISNVKEGGGKFYLLGTLSLLEK